ncbi:hypothetical protein [Thalassotalea sp. PLHSN55]|uniref:hypothetical protein n=1 Tax=Thalassotalea sp. PLHSN55 TaxID=3435888 RepID=UPI003F8562BA
MLEKKPTPDQDKGMERKFHRWQFQSNDIPLFLQSRGVPIKIYRSWLFYHHGLGNGVIKDISLAGAGFLSSRRLPDKLVIELPNGKRIKCTKQHHFAVNEQLIFYGVSWGEEVYQQVLPYLKSYSRKAYRGREKKIGK